ncbi:18296_t:CDS:2 [Acaulospora morrowiae]|uniref:18296_t:CDS:1 n=1 Tax=Acaulospora morrowiae TaxID=94023 RepID=A0A9N9CM66_9GLOM|nr:18296_t:CDS:2 [Acaulospora morrowiae]
MQTHERNFILGLSASSFISGVIGSLWYTKHKVKSLSEEFSPSTSIPLTHVEKVTKYRQATLYSLQAFTVGTILCISVGGLCAIGIGTLLGVSNIREFHEKMKGIIPRYVPSSRDSIKDTKQDELSDSEQDELRILQEEWQKYLLEKKLKSEEKKNPENKKWWQK